MHHTYCMYIDRYTFKIDLFIFWTFMFIFLSLCLAAVFNNDRIAQIGFLHHALIFSNI